MLTRTHLGYSVYTRNGLDGFINLKIMEKGDLVRKHLGSNTPNWVVENAIEMLEEHDNSNSENVTKLSGKCDKPELLMVPDNIKIERCGGGDALGIVFNENQVLCFCSVNNKYAVVYVNKKDLIPCHLIPCTEFKERHTYCLKSDIEYSPNYGKYINGKIISIVDNFPIIFYKSFAPENYYQVVPLKD